jgi:hypothetical protein
MIVNAINLKIFKLPPSMGGYTVEVKLHLGIIDDIIFYDDEFNALMIVPSSHFNLINVNTIVHIKSIVYATN